MINELVSNGGRGLTPRRHRRPSIGRGIKPLLQFQAGLTAIAQFCALFLLPTLALAASDFETARALFDQKKFPEARAAFEKIVATEPNNAAACHYLGRSILARNDTASFEESLKWLGHAAEIEPNNAIYLGIYGGTSLQLAERNKSYFAATRGRDAMEKALTLDPNYAEAREGLFQFYQRAPWPLGNLPKAAAHLAEIRKRAPARAAALSAITKADARDFAGAFAVCEEVIVKDPDAYLALYQYGRAASLSGQNLDRGLTCLQRCLKLQPDNSADPTHSHVWMRIGRIQEQLKHPTEARAAYEASLKVDPYNQPAADALAKLR